MEKSMVNIKREISKMVDEDVEMYSYGDLKLCDAPPKRLLCGLCGNIMKNPIQTFRGEIACKTCYDKKKGDNNICPIDGDVLESDIVYFGDKAKNIEIEKLACFCLNEGCSWQGELHERNDHVEKCKHTPRKCTLCDQGVQYGDSFEEHLDSCEKWIEERNCLYKNCIYKPKNSIDLKRHLQDEVINHAYLYTSTINQLKNDFKTSMVKIEETMNNKNTEKESDMQQLKTQMTLLMEYATNMQNKYDEKTNSLVARINELEAENTKQRTDVNTADSVNMQALTKNVNLIQKNISDMTLRQQINENTSMDGKLVWKIDNLKERAQKAKNGTVTALHSAPVFTSKYGYKFCARLYLNGDGMGKDTHVSLFFVMMRSEYDDLLEWPFTKQVRFRLINPVNSNRDITESFIPDRNSSSFKKPTKEMNIAAGCPLFVPKEDLWRNGFVKNDALYIEVEVSDY